MLKKLPVILSVLIFTSCQQSGPTVANNTMATSTTVTSSTDPDAPIQVPDFDLDHYKFWKTNNDQPLNATIDLNEPGRGPWQAKLGRIEYIGNPAKKTHRKKTYTIKNEHLHYLAYLIQPPNEHTRPAVEVLNQFTDGFERWRLGKPVWLLVPASKTLVGEPPDPPHETHFACHAVLEFPPSLTIQDQFDRKQDQNKVEDITPMRPSHFCVPVRKHHGNGAEPQDPTTGLAAYPIRPDNYSVAPKTRDQFGPHDFTVLRSEYLLVPSRFK